MADRIVILCKIDGFVHSLNNDDSEDASPVVFPSVEEAERYIIENRLTEGHDGEVMICNYDTQEMTKFDNSRTLS